MKKVLFFIFLNLIVSSVALSQDELVNDGAFPEAEFDVAINPLDSNNIVIACQSGFGNFNSFVLSIYYTYDFGVTWQKSNYDGTVEPSSASGDPVLSFDAAGNVYLVNLRLVAGNNVAVYLSKSSDGGANWSQGSAVALDNCDKPWLAIDRHASSPYVGNIYVPILRNNVILYRHNGTQVTHSQQIPDGDHLPSVVVKKDGTVFTSVVDLTSPNRV
ncbi:glycoside hydrolase, partial [Crocinitomicaceae bacterium]|nr:glycoside hydrolase [Crocinitomicaceae bacterium]